MAEVVKNADIDTDANEKWTQFWDKFVEVVDRHAPRKNVKIKLQKDQPFEAAPFGQLYTKDLKVHPR